VVILREGDRKQSQGGIPAGIAFGDLFSDGIYEKEERGTMYMVSIDKGKCDGDGTCANVCPQSVFKVEGGKADPVNMSECINCLTCVENCPQQAITVNEI